MRNFKKVMTLTLTMVMLVSSNVCAFAGNDVKTSTDVSVEDNLRLIESDLEGKGTSVSNELSQAVQKLRDEQLICNEASERDKLQALIDTTLDLKDSYDTYSIGETTRGITDKVFTPAIAAVASYFSSRGYLLSFELLVHAENNNVLNSNYVPHYGNRITSSSVVMKIKSGGKDASGSGSFENSGTIVQKDLYYAIHAFNYNYVRNTGKFTLKDRYDFAYGTYYGIAGIAIDTMWAAQNAGVLVPYYVNIVV